MQTSAGALNVTIGGAIPGVKFDQLDVNGSASLNGTLNVKLASGFTPPIGTTFDILNAASIIGAFTTITGLSINSSEHLAVRYNGDDVVLAVVSGPAAAGSVMLARLPQPVIGGRWAHRNPLTAAAPQPVAIHAPAPVLSVRTPFLRASLRPRDELGAPAASAGPAATFAGSVPASVFNPMASMNHRYFECGVSLNALVHTTPRRLLHSLHAGSPEAVGYIVMTPAR